MASDLSKLIQDSITLTLNGLLAKDAKIIEITKMHAKDAENLQILKVTSVFNFSEFSSELSFLIPAQSSSLIFNTMMGSPITELSTEIDDDAEDAIGEFISNTSGSLTTAINAEGLEDIGQTKFNISHKEVLLENTPLNLDDTYKFKIDLEGHELIIFIEFDAPIHPYISEIASSEITYYEEIKERPVKEEIQEEPQVKEEKVNDTESKEDQAEEEIEENGKTKKLKLVIIIVASFIVVLLFSFFIMYILGVFDPEPEIEKKVNPNTPKIEKDENNIKVIKYPPIKKVNFEITDINTKRLNNKLEELTKYNVLNKEELEAQKLAEKNRLFELEREKELLEFSKNNHEEPLYEIKEPDQKRIIEKKTLFQKETFKETTKNELTSKNKSDIINNEKAIENAIEKFPYVVTNSFKYSLFKTLVQKTDTKQARISICNNNEGTTAIYIGPFENIKLQNTMLELIEKNDPSITTQAVSITEENFNIKCNLE